MTNYNREDLKNIITNAVASNLFPNYDHDNDVIDIEKSLPDGVKLNETQLSMLRDIVKNLNREETIVISARIFYNLYSRDNVKEIEKLFRVKKIDKINELYGKDIEKSCNTFKRYIEDNMMSLVNIVNELFKFIR